MPDAKPIDLFASLRTKRDRTNTRNKAWIEFSAPSLTFAPDEAALAEGVATTIASAIKDNLLGGRAPDGSPLPAVAAATIERRAYRDEQFGRTTEKVVVGRGKTAGRQRTDWVEQGVAGQRSAEQKRAKRRASRLKLRFRGLRVGTFDPRTHDNQTFGVESGMLAHSVFAKATGRGTWAVYFADNRTRIDRTGHSAVARVFNRIGLWSSAAMRQPAVQTALRQLSAAVLWRRAGSVLAQAKQTIQRLSSIATETENIGAE